MPPKYGQFRQKLSKFGDFSQKWVPLCFRWLLSNLRKICSQWPVCMKNVLTTTFRIFKRTLEYSNEYSNIKTNIRLFKRIVDYSNDCSNIQANIRIFIRISNACRTNEHFQQTDIQKYTKTEDRDTLLAYLYQVLGGCRARTAEHSLPVRTPPYVCAEQLWRVFSYIHI